MQKIEVSNGKKENIIEHLAPSATKSADLGLESLCVKVENGTVGKWTVSLDGTGCTCPEGKTWKKDSQANFSCK
jgi:hypothetical protein